MHDKSTRFWQRYSLVVSLILVVVGGMGFVQSQQRPRFEEIDVERINVIEQDGTVKLVIANRSRAPDQVMDGRSKPRAESNKSAGITFFNDEGDEAGGLKIRGGPRDGGKGARAHLLFDQYKQDQTLGLIYEEANGKRSAGLTVWDRPDTSLPEMVDRITAAQQVADPAARAEAQRAIDDAARRGEFGATRVYVGKTRDRDAVLTLSDAIGRARMRLVVSAAGDARIDFLDEAGRTVSSLPDRPAGKR
jgi:hypothetical protein